MVAWSKNGLLITPKGYAAEPVDREVLVQRGGIGRVLEPEKPRGITISRMEADLKKGLFDVGE